jgi:hypothetical protein
MGLPQQQAPKWKEIRYYEWRFDESLNSFQNSLGGIDAA